MGYFFGGDLKDSFVDILLMLEMIVEMLAFIVEVDVEVCREFIDEIATCEELSAWKAAVPMSAIYN